MFKWTVEVTETLSRLVEVIAEDAEDAITQARIQYHDCDIVLDDNDYIDTEFCIYDEPEEIEETKE